MKETDAIDEYILQHIDEESDYLKALYRDTHVKLLRPRMASGHLQGRMPKQKNIREQKTSTSQGRIFSAPGWAPNIFTPVAGR